jgi:vancomycin resistance protein YoaR
LTNRAAVFKIGSESDAVTRLEASPLQSWLKRPALQVGLAALLGATLGLLAVPSMPAPEDPHAVPPTVLLLGKGLPPDERAEEQALERLRQHVAGWLQLDLDGTLRQLSYADLGAAIDTVRLGQLLRDSRDATSPLRRTRHRAGLVGAIALPVPVALDTATTAALLRRLKDELDQVPRDARIDVASRQIVPERLGRHLDVDATLGAIQLALQQGNSRVSAVFRRQDPKRRAQELTSVRYDNVVAYFETPYDRSDKSQARTFNLRHAAAKLDGTVLLPGESFDFNATVGPRDEAHGFQVAQVIAEGEIVDGIGGGTCQISGTLHGAAFFAGLEIVERNPHTRPSSYMKLGLDAAVAYPTLNFRFRNTLPFPIVLHETVADGSVRAEILGAEVGPAVTYIRRIESATHYDQVERPDSRLASGKRSLLQRGVPGFKLKRYRVVRNDEHGVRDVWHDSYPPTTQVVLVGTGNDQKREPPKGDPHPEYLADELLVLTKQRATADEPTRFSERREAGRFGVDGWTQALGMPQFEVQ